MALHVAGHEFLSFKIEGWGGDPLLPWGVTMSVYRKKKILIRNIAFMYMTFHLKKEVDSVDDTCVCKYSKL